VRYHDLGRVFCLLLAGYKSEPMKGQLTAQPLAELIREISDKGLSGALRLERERAQTIIYFDKGRVTYAAANLKALRLREYLIKRGLVSQKELATLASNPPDLVLASALTSSGKVQQRDMDALMSVLVSDVLRVALLWTEGSWHFNERGKLADSIHVNVEPVGLMREAIQRWPASYVAERLRNPSEVFTRGSNISRTSNFQASESFLLSRLDTPLRLGELVSLSGLPEPDAHRTIYGLALSGLVEREFWQNAFRTDPKANKETSSAAAETDAAPQRSDNWLAASASDEADELDQFLSRQRNATNHYEVLELTPDATPSQIKNAYYAMARRYHPDRFHLKSGTKLHAEISTLFARITQVYEILTNPERRATYDLALARAKKVESAKNQEDQHSDVFDEESTAEPAQADQYFREGFGALEQGRIDSAMKHLATAVRLAPQVANYRAYYGRALAADINTRRLAENEIQIAVKLEPENTLYRTMLAELYFDLKFYRRAQTEIERVLAKDPKNGMANLLLRKLEKSRKVG
jgi:curved DNA-binding protein CbpA